MDTLIFKILYRKKANWELIRDDMKLDNMYLQRILAKGIYPERLPAEEIKRYSPKELMTNVKE